MIRTAFFAIYLATTSSVVAANDAAVESAQCEHFREGQKQVFWGDLHVHTSYSMDAYAFGNRHDPRDAYAFGRGQQLTLADGITKVQLERPLDFMAVTDHAETFDVMYLCTDPRYLDNNYCKVMRKDSVQESSLSVFRNYLLPIIAGETPVPSKLCAPDAENADSINCPVASQRQWRRTQEQANAANSPCEFTTFIGNEWSATPNDQHWHRNLIYANDAVSEQAIDYVRYPTVDKLWQALDEQCVAEQGCDVISIPHNTNLSEGGGFDIENSSDRSHNARARYERLIEIYQSKGGSECLPEHWDDTNADCNFEILLPRSASGKLEENALKKEEWQQLRASYARSVLKRGVLAAERSESGLNPLQLGFIGSTDNHTATAGLVDEANWPGDAWGWGNDVSRRFQRMHYNPGGMVAVWSEENTRASVFAALKRREVYATSGPRIALNVQAFSSPKNNPCDDPDALTADAVMGGVLTNTAINNPQFVVRANMDKVPLSKVEIIKTSVVNGEAVEQVSTVMESKKGRSELCVAWQDSAFNPQEHALWYVRVLEKPTPRWSKLDCERANNCKDFPEANKLIQERAWASPIWYTPNSETSQ
ncbi:MAG: DUF3604 domain-containing protein [Pseudomonadales bacterium]